MIKQFTGYHRGKGSRPRQQTVEAALLYCDESITRRQFASGAPAQGA